MKRFLHSSGVSVGSIVRHEGPDEASLGQCADQSCVLSIAVQHHETLDGSDSKGETLSGKCATDFVDGSVTGGTQRRPDR